MRTREAKRQSFSHFSQSPKLESAASPPSHKPTRSLLLGHRPKPVPLRLLTRTDSSQSQALLKGLQLMAKLYGPVPREKEEISGNRQEPAQQPSITVPCLPILPAIQSPLSLTCKNSTLAALQDFEVGSRRLSHYGHNRSISGNWNRLSLQSSKPCLQKLHSSVSSQSIHSSLLFQFPPISHQSTL